VALKWLVVYISGMVVSAWAKNTCRTLDLFSSSENDVDVILIGFNSVVVAVVALHNISDIN
jgi:hypothetical protein